MVIKADFTPVKKTLFIRQFRKDGSLVRKRVVKGNIQYDTCFTRKKEPWDTIVTDRANSNQILLHAPKKVNFLQRIVFALINPSNVKIVKTKKGRYLFQNPEICPDYKKITDPLEKKFTGHIHELTGFTDPYMNAAEKEAWKKLMFR